MTKLFPAACAALLASACLSPLLAEEPQAPHASPDVRPIPPPVTTPLPAPTGAAGELAQKGALTVSEVKLARGLRASKIIGAAVYNDANERIGSVDDIILASGDRAVIAVIQVGGFLGAGGKLVAVPFDHVRVEDTNKVVVSGANKDALNAMPTFTYGS